MCWGVCAVSWPRSAARRMRGPWAHLRAAALQALMARVLCHHAHMLLRSCASLALPQLSAAALSSACCIPGCLGELVDEGEGEGRAQGRPGAWPSDIFGSVDPSLALWLSLEGGSFTNFEDSASAGNSSFDGDVAQAGAAPPLFQREPSSSSSSSSATWTPISSRRPASFAGGFRQLSGGSFALSRHSGMSWSLSREASSASFSTSVSASWDGPDGQSVVSDQDCNLVCEVCEACSEAVNKAAATFSDLSLCQPFQIAEPEHDLVPRLLKHGYVLLDIENLPPRMGTRLRAPEHCWAFASESLCRLTDASAHSHESPDGWGGEGEESACIESCCDLLTQSYGTSHSDTNGHILVVHLPDQKHWAIRNVSGQAEKSFSRSYWESKSGKCLPRRVTGREGVEVDPSSRKTTSRSSILDDSAVWELDAVGVRKCRLHAANSRQLRLEATQFLQMFEDEVSGNEVRPKMKLTRSAAESKLAKSKRDLVACANSSVLNQGLEVLLPSLRSLEHVCHVASRHLAASVFKASDDVGEAISRLAGRSTASAAAHAGRSGEGALCGGARVYRPFPSHQLRSAGTRGGELLTPFSSQQDVCDVLIEAVRASAPLLEEQDFEEAFYLIRCLGGIRDNTHPDPGGQDFEDEDEEKDGQRFGSAVSLKAATRALSLAVSVRTLRGEPVHALLALALARCKYAWDRLAPRQSTVPVFAGANASLTGTSASCDEVAAGWGLGADSPDESAEKAARLAQPPAEARPTSANKWMQNDSPRTAYLRQWCMAAGEADCSGAVAAPPRSPWGPSGHIQEHHADGSCGQAERPSEQPSNDSAGFTRGQGGRVLGRVLTGDERQRCLVEAGHEIGSLTWVKGKKLEPPFQSSAFSFRGFGAANSAPTPRAELWDGDRPAVYEALLNNHRIAKGAARVIKYQKRDSTALRQCAQLIKFLSNDVHPGVARYLGSSLVASDELLVLTEFFAEGSLRRWISSMVKQAQPSALFVTTPPASDRPLVPPDTIREYSRQLVETVAYLHETLNLAHRNISASSVFLADNGTRVRLTDLEDSILIEDCSKGPSIHGHRSDRLGIGNVVAEMVTGIVVKPQQADPEVPTAEECADDGLFEFLHALLDENESGVLDLLRSPFLQHRRPSGMATSTLHHLL